VINIKGSGIDLVTFVVFSAVMILMSITGSILLPQLSIESNLRSSINADKNQYRTYMATVTLLNKEAKQSLRRYQHTNNKDRMESYLEERAGKILCPLSETYSLELSNTDFSIKEGSGGKKYSTVLIASPSRKLVSATIGLGETRSNKPNSLGSSCEESDYP